MKSIYKLNRLNFSVRPIRTIVLSLDSDATVQNFHTDSHIMTGDIREWIVRDGSMGKLGESSFEIPRYIAWMRFNGN